MKHSHSYAGPSYTLVFAIGTALNMAFVIVEAVYGLLSNSLALIADAGHNLGDVLALLLAWGAAHLAQRKPTRTKTYGLRRGTILAALISALILLMTMAVVAWEAIDRFATPSVVDSTTVIIVATIGVVINLTTALLFLSGKDDDLNVKAAFMHMAADAAVSFGVVIAGIAIMLTGIFWLDPSVSLLIVAVVILSTWTLLHDSFNLVMDGVPKGIDPDAVRKFILEQDDVKEIHDLHIWGMSTTHVALTAHIVRNTTQLDDHFLHRMCADLQKNFGIVHPTIQVETGVDVQPCEQAHPDSI